MSGASLLRVPFAAVSFLTRFPVGKLVAVDAKDIARSVPLFPLVGGVVGGAAGLSADLLAGPLPAAASAAIAVAVAALLTGAMHLDALADTADGLGAATPARALEIMRDPAIGTFGATALLVVLLVDASAYAGLGASGDAALAGLAAGAASRAAMLPLALALPIARPGPSQGRMLAGIGLPGVAAAQLVAVALVLPAGVAGLAALAAAWFAAVVLGLFYRRWLGGVTGDLLGAAAKTGESAGLLTALWILS